MHITKKRRIYIASVFSILTASVFGLQASIAQGNVQTQGVSAPQTAANVSAASSTFDTWAEKNLPTDTHPFRLFRQTLPSQIVKTASASNQTQSSTALSQPVSMTQNQLATAATQSTSSAVSNTSSTTHGSHHYHVASYAKSASTSSTTTTQHDSLYWLSHVIEAEAGGESQEAKLAVGEVIMNRTASPDYPHTIHGVIFQVTGGTYAFTSVQLGTINKTPSTDSIAAAKAVLAGEAHVVPNALVFYNASETSGSNWVRTQPTVATVDHLTFAR